MTNKSDDELRQEVRKAEKEMSDLKALLLLKHPFFGVMLSTTDFIPERNIPTMATDGIRIYFNPSYVLNLTKDERRGVLLHEISHCIYLHCSPKRRLNREHKRWNVSTDYIVNLDLRDMGFSLPQGVLLDEKYRDMTAEQVYDALPKDISNLETLDTHIHGADEDWDDMEDRIVAAYEMSQNQGNGHGDVPNGMKRWLDKIKNSKVKWERIFHKYVGDALAKDDFSYERCNRRMLPQNIYLPSLRNHIIRSVVVAVDTSGSITESIVETFAGELNKISHLVEEVTILTCDAAVHEIVKIRQMEDFMKKVQFKGGGGTDFRPVFRTVEDLRIQPSLLIYLTDGFGTHVEKTPPYPVMWCLTDERGAEGIKFGGIVMLPK